MLRRYHQIVPAGPKTIQFLMQMLKKFEVHFDLAGSSRTKLGLAAFDPLDQTAIMWIGDERTPSIVQRFSLAPSTLSEEISGEGLAHHLHRFLERHPFAEVVFHRFGDLFDASLVSLLMSPHPDFHIPTEIEVASLPSHFRSLGESLRQSARQCSAQGTYQLLFQYPKEADQARYELYGTRGLRAMNNRRGIIGSVMRSLEREHINMLFLYRAGSPLDARLLRIILAEDPTDGMVDRPLRVVVQTPPSNDPQTIH